MKKNCLLITISLFLLNCEKATIKKKKTGVIAQKAMVVSARVEASKIGLDILKKNGNAYDAMVATHFALAETTIAFWAITPVFFFFIVAFSQFKINKEIVISRQFFFISLIDVFKFLLYKFF